MTSNSDVIRWGTDSSGRPIYLTRLAAAWLDDLRAVCKAHGFELVPVQGSFMARLGGGASASAGFHDKAGAIDFRIWNLTTAQQRFLVREARRRGGAAYLRGAPWDSSGMDPHCHVTLGWDAGELDAGLAAAWRDYLVGGNGLSGSSHARDPHYRPSPLVKSWHPAAPPKPVPAADRLRLRAGALAHVAQGVPYFLLNSIRGLRHAARAGKRRADRDLQITKDGVVVVSHWSRPLLPHGPRKRDVFRDPEGKLGRTRTIASMTWAEVDRLRAADGYRINTLRADMAEAGRLGIGLVLEPKTRDLRWRNPNLWRDLAAYAQLHGVPSLSGYVLRANRAAAPAMRAGGIPTKVLRA